jgi:hypothetical protein
MMMVQPLHTVHELLSAWAQPTLMPEPPTAVRCVLGDQHDHDPSSDAACVQARQTVVAPHRGPTPHTDDGVGVRRIMHKLRSRAIENLNAQFKGVSAVHGQARLRGWSTPAALPWARCLSVGSPHGTGMHTG